MAKSKHFWQFEVLHPKSRWILVTPSEFAKSLGLYVIELGHFFQSGYCYTRRMPEDSFIISFPAPGQQLNDGPLIMNYKGKTYRIGNEVNKSVMFLDNRPGYTQEQTSVIESYFISFGGSLAEKFYNLFTERSKSLFCEIEWIPTIINSFEELVLLYKQPANEMKDLYTSMVLNRLLTHLVMEVDSRKSLHVNNPYVVHTMKIIEHRFPENLKLQDIARELHINSSYLSRLIAKETGSSFSSCLTHARINHAKELLFTSSISIDSIATQCGFCNASHFIKLFRQQENMTPFQYRSMRQKGVTSLTLE